jgi:hypothetical protein
MAFVMENMSGRIMSDYIFGEIILRKISRVWDKMKGDWERFSQGKTEKRNTLTTHAHPGNSTCALRLNRTGALP